MTMLFNTFSFRVKIGNITPKERTQYVQIIFSVSFSHRIYKRSLTRRLTEVCDSHEPENGFGHFCNFHSTFIYVWYCSYTVKHLSPYTYGYVPALYTYGYFPVPYTYGYVPAPNPYGNFPSPILTVMFRLRILPPIFPAVYNYGYDPAPYTNGYVSAPYTYCYVPAPYIYGYVPAPYTYSYVLVPYTYGYVSPPLNILFFHR